MKHINKPYLSIIVPVFNESKRLQNLSNIFDYLKMKKFTHEVIIVNDGSMDNTLELLKQINKKYKFTILSYEKNRGKGYAVKTGMLRANGKYRLFIDIDFSTPIGELDAFLKYINSYDVVVASRRLPQSRVLVHQPYIREFMGHAFTKLSQYILNISISDFTCGFKCFSSKAAKDIFSCSRIERWGFDSELLFIAHKLGYSIKELPVHWKDNAHTKVRFPGDAMQSFAELVTIRINDLKGMYKKHQHHRW